MALRDRSFIDFYVVNEHLRRFLNTREPIDYVLQSVVGFWVATLFWLLPWALFLPGALASAIRYDKRRLGIPLLWAAWVIGFFTLTGARLEYYALPAFPALSVLLAAYFRRLFRSRAAGWQMQLPALALLGASLCAVPKVFLFPSGGTDFLTAMITNVDGYYREYFAHHPEQSFAFVHEVFDLARPFTLLLGVVGGGVALSLRTGSPLGVRAARRGMIPCLGVVDLGMRLITADRSQREFASIVADHWSDGAKLVVVGAYEDLCGLTYYTHRSTQMLDPNPEDLLFGRRKGDATDLFLTPEAFEREWQSDSQVFVLSHQSFALSGAIVLAQSPRDILRTNHSL